MLELGQSVDDRRRALPTAFEGALGQHGLGDDKLADEIDETVDLVEIHTNGLLDGGHRGCGARCGWGLRLDGRRRRWRRLARFRGRVHGLDLRRDVGRGVLLDGGQRGDLQIAVADHEFEGLLDCLPARDAVQDQIPRRDRIRPDRTRPMRATWRGRQSPSARPIRSTHAGSVAAHWHGQRARHGARNGWPNRSGRPA